MRMTHVLLLAVCIVVASCGALSAYASEQEAVAVQHSTPEYSDTFGKRLLRSDSFATVDDDDEAEERAFPGLSKFSEMITKGKTKVSSHQLLKKYQKMLKLGLSDEAITGAWLTRKKTTDNIFERWIRLGKSERQAANNLLKQGKSPEDLYAVFTNRGMKPEQISKLWNDLKLKPDQLANFQKKFVLVNN